MIRSAFGTIRHPFAAIWLCATVILSLLRVGDASAAPERIRRIPEAAVRGAGVRAPIRVLAVRSLQDQKPVEVTAVKARITADPRLTALLSYAEKLRFVPNIIPAWGKTATVTLVTGSTGAAVTRTVAVQCFDVQPAAGSPNTACTVRVSDGSSDYLALLVARNGDLKKIEEYTVSQVGESARPAVLRAQSWWSCVKEEIRKHGGECVTSVLDCLPVGAEAKSLAAYLLCIGVKCGTVFLSASYECKVHPPAEAAEKLERGSTGDRVSELQRRLNKFLSSVGKPLLTVDGDFGFLTEEAVRAFQQAKGLAVDGIVGPLTWGWLPPE